MPLPQDPAQDENHILASASSRATAAKQRHCAKPENGERGRCRHDCVDPWREAVASQIARSAPRNVVVGRGIDEARHPRPLVTSPDETEAASPTTATRHPQVTVRVEAGEHVVRGELWI